MIGVGSLLQKCVVPELSLFKRLAGFFQPELQVLSSGFIRAVPDNMVLCRKLDVRAVRGEKTREIIERLSGKPCSAATGDGGMLYPLLLDTMPEKKYTLGVIPHYRDQSQSAVKELVSQYDNAVIIDVLDEPLEVLKQIARCNFILSSSLHGLIVADALDIPNRHVRFSGNVTGDDFKFCDYYSVFTPEYQLESLTPEKALAMSKDELFGAYISKRERIAGLQDGLLRAMKR